MKLAIAIVTALFLVHPLRMVVAQETRKVHEDGGRRITVGLGIPDSIDFHGHIGIAVAAFPEYEGSDTTTAVAQPFVDIKQSNFLFLNGPSVNPNDGQGRLGWNALNLGYEKSSKQKLRISVGPVLRYGGGRDEDDSDSLNGLGNIDGGYGLGGFVEIVKGSWSADLTASPQDAGDAGDGVLVAFATQYTAQVNDKIAISTGISSSWGNDDYMQGFFGVSNSQATQSGLAPFDAGAGFKDVGIQIGATFTLSPDWMAEGQVGYQRFLGNAGDSPIVDSVGSRDQIRVLFGVAYQF